MFKEDTSIPIPNFYVLIVEPDYINTASSIIFKQKDVDTLVKTLNQYKILHTLIRVDEVTQISTYRHGEE